MFGSTVLDIGIGIVAAYLGLSLICSAINELLSAATRARAVELERGIRNLLDGTSQLPLRWWSRIRGKTAVAGAWSETFFGHQLINALSKDDQKPSYIPSQTFARVLLHMVNAAIGPAGDGAALPLSGLPSFDGIRAAILAMPGGVANNRIKEFLLPLVDQAHADLTDGVSAIQKFNDQIESWYNQSMDRVSGWYKRRTQLMLFVIAILTAFALNVDTVAIARALGRNQALSQSVVAAAQNVVARSPAGSTQPADANAGDLHKAVSDVEDSVGNIYQLGIPMGWTTWADAHPQNRAYSPRDDNLDDVLFQSWGMFFTKLFGLLVTACAASLGVPFWFDVLSQIMSIRSSGKPPEVVPPAGATGG